MPVNQEDKVLMILKDIKSLSSEEDFLNYSELEKTENDLVSLFKLFI
jgi:hypothetical protein